MHILLCTLLTIYTGSVDASSAHTDVQGECKAVSLERARKQIQKCAGEGPERCEVIISADKKRITLESKIVVGASK